MRSKKVLISPEMSAGAPQQPKVDPDLSTTKMYVDPATSPGEVPKALMVTGAVQLLDETGITEPIAGDEISQEMDTPFSKKAPSSGITSGGGFGHETVTVKLQMAWLPLVSVTSKVLMVVPMKLEPLGNPEICCVVADGQLSKITGSRNVTTC
mmetsp:Transcript_2861/g.5762  ORF Transcript_2861/g.5762 Transcript_2861/m.5762 type:complete len:153 (-) Transcript_2861:420-878(-)